MKKEFIEYIDYLKSSNYSKWTIDKKIATLNKINDFMRSHIIGGFESINASKVIDFKYYLIDKKLSMYTVNNHMKQFRAFLNYLVNRKILIQNPFNNLKREFEVASCPDNIRYYHDERSVEQTNQHCQAYY